MKNKLKIMYSGIVIATITMLLVRCSKKLEEHPYTVFTTAFLQTPNGIQSAVNTLYEGMRFNYGPEPSLALNVFGTDEFTGGDQVIQQTGGAYVRSFAIYGGSAPIQASDGSISAPWNANYSYINLANGVLALAPGITMDNTAKNVILGEAHFLRGLYYMLLVEQFGAVPVDLGSGDYQFNQTAYQGFNRLPIDTVLSKDYQVMINDFTFASQNLPDQRPTNAFKLSKAAALCMLAKSYIFRGYSSKAQPSDFSSAYTTAMQLINNQAQYGVALQQDYGKVHAQGNDYNSEILYSVERLPNDLADNETPNSTNTAGAGNNASVDFAPNYTTVTNVKAPGVGREAIWGRPYRRFAPTSWLLNICFADKDNDSRFDNSFRMVWFTTVGGAAGAAINYGDTAFLLAKTKNIADSMNALVPRKPYPIIPPSQFYTNQNNDPQNIYPYLQKFADSAKGNYNDVVSGRPFIVAKLSEVYLLAAEAAMQAGNTTGAATLINVLKTRAAYRPSLTSAQIATRAANLQVTGGQINLDFILDERSRELCGESNRFPDLAMRGKLVSRVQAFNPDASPYVQAFHVLRPIPQSQLNAVTNSNPLYQNPGY